MYITFFNQGDHLTPVFTTRPDRGSNFYWLHDRFHSHVSIAKQDRYLHLFVKDPEKDGIKFWFMQDNKSWDDVCRYYQRNKKSLTNITKVKK